LGEVSVLSQLHRAREKRKKEDTHCVPVQQRSTDLCTDSTAILPRFIYVVDMNYDPFLDLLAPPTIFDERTLRRPHK
jgi:hypothetical protein